MKVIVSEFKIKPEKKHALLDILVAKLGINKRDVLEYKIIKESIDARDKNNIKFVYNIIIDVSLNKYDYLLKQKNVKPYSDEVIELQYDTWNKLDRPIIVGFGPAGMFASLYLARCHASPIIIERGSEIEQRIIDVEDFLKNKNLNPNSNVQFGEGGAGTFSDGKLTTSLKDPLIKWIINEFAKHGAPKDIIYESMPHIGTDYLRKVVKNIRNEIISLGGEFYFNEQFISYKKSDNNIEVITNKRSLKTSHLILGFGHSARDTIKMLFESGCNMEAKSFSMGVRIEHQRQLINKSQYAKYADMLSPAYYKLSCHLPSGRSVYTFCMCPGGEVMASTNEEGSIVTNGMSYRARDKQNSNSGLLVNVDPKDFVKTSPLDGLDYQEKYERLAYLISRDYKAPANLCKEFLEGRVAKEIRSVIPSYPHGVKLADLSLCLPEFVITSLKEAIPLLNNKLKGFSHPDAVLTGIESRSSCPIRMIRDSLSRESNIKGIYPIGEGAGYAGGITSAALDGLKTAIKISLE